MTLRTITWLGHQTESQAWHRHNPGQTITQYTPIPSSEYPAVENTLQYDDVNLDYLIKSVTPAVMVMTGSPVFVLTHNEMPHSMSGVQ